MNKIIDKHGKGCPECGGEQLCPCESCVSRHFDQIMWKWDEIGEFISCGHCGHTMHADEWNDLDYQRWKQEKKDNDK